MRDHKEILTNISKTNFVPNQLTNSLQKTNNNIEEKIQNKNNTFS